MKIIHTTSRENFVEELIESLRNGDEDAQMEIAELIKVQALMDIADQLRMIVHKMENVPF